MLTGILIILPLVFAILVLLAKKERMIRGIALFGSMAGFALSLAALCSYLWGCRCLLEFDIAWLSSLGISLKFGMDGLSLLMVLLTTFLVPLIFLSGFGRHFENPAWFHSLVLLMQTGLIGVFTASDGLMFYIFWEITLIPAYFICALWGGDKRISVTFKFFLYTFFGSLFMLVALLWVYYRTPVPHSFAIRDLYMADLSPAEQLWVMLAFFLAFAIKIPVFPFHTWQPDTYAVSPAQGAMLLAGLMLKMGIYGVIRFMVPVTHEALSQYGFILVILAVTGIVYASLIAIRQQDMKRLVAYSSIAHVGLMAAGAFILAPVALNGAVIQMLSHGVNIVGLFAVIEFIERRTGVRDIRLLRGLSGPMPILSIFFMIILLGSIALPLTNGFIGEFMLLLGLFRYNWIFAAVAGLSIILGAVYMLWMYQRVMLGEPDPSFEGKDLTATEIITLVPVVILIFWIGLFPGPFLDIAGPVIRNLLTL